MRATIWNAINFLRTPTTPRRGTLRFNSDSDNSKADEIDDDNIINRQNELRLQEAQIQESKTTIVNNSCVSCFSGYSKKGYSLDNPKKKNQDSCFMFEHEESHTIMFCILDGHGEEGEKVSGFFRDHFPKEITENRNFLSNPQLAIAETVNSLETKLFNEYIDSRCSGTTFCLCFIRGFQLIVANIGDSRVILGSRSPSHQYGIAACPISIDHKPDLPEEKERILRYGGRVFGIHYGNGQTGPSRVWLGNRDIPGLAMSRSLGDTIAHSVGVSSIPDFFENTIDPEIDCCLVIASDGLWEFVENQEAINIAAGFKEPHDAVRALIHLANGRWLKEEQVIDDTTIYVIFLNNWIGNEEIS